MRLALGHHVDLVVAAKSLVILRPLDLESRLRQLALKCRSYVRRRQFDVLKFPRELYLLDWNILPEVVNHNLYRGLTTGQNNLTKSASRGAHSPVRGHPRGSKVVPLNSLGRVSY